MSADQDHDQISLGMSVEITIGAHRTKAWPKAEVSRTRRAGESYDEALSETAAMLDEAIEESIKHCVALIENYS